MVAQYSSAADPDSGQISFVLFSVADPEWFIPDPNQALNFPSSRSGSRSRQKFRIHADPDPQIRFYWIRIVFLFRSGYTLGKVCMDTIPLFWPSKESGVSETAFFLKLRIRIFIKKNNPDLQDCATCITHQIIVNSELAVPYLILWPGHGHVNTVGVGPPPQVLTTPGGTCSSKVMTF